MLNAVIYDRFSSSTQHEESIEDQLRECQEFADKEWLQVINTYCDYAISGKTDNRDQFQKIIKNAEKQLFQSVIIYKIDHFAHNRWDSAIYKKRLKECGVKVIPAKEVIPDGPRRNYFRIYLRRLGKNVQCQPCRKYATQPVRQ